MVREEDLDDALFYFGCAKIHLDDNQNSDVKYVFEDNLDEGKKAHQMIVSAIEKAESESCHNNQQWNRQLSSDKKHSCINERYN